MIETPKIKPSQMGMFAALAKEGEDDKHEKHNFLKPSLAVGRENNSAEKMGPVKNNLGSNHCGPNVGGGSQHGGKVVSLAYKEKRTNQA